MLAQTVSRLLAASRREAAEALLSRAIADRARNGWVWRAPRLAEQMDVTGMEHSGFHVPGSCDIATSKSQPCSAPSSPTIGVRCRQASVTDGLVARYRAAPSTPGACYRPKRMVVGGCRSRGDTP
jgi:hypothetical protein